LTRDYRELIFLFKDQGSEFLQFYQWMREQTRGEMGYSKNDGSGLRRLIQKFRNEFKRPENTEFYSEKDFKEAERKYVKFCLSGKLESDDTKEIKS
jgi:hypothetical protein